MNNGGRSVKDKREIVFWDCMDSETLVHEDQDEAIEFFLDSMMKPLVPIGDQDLPETVEVKGYARVLAGITADDVLGYAFDELGSEYGYCQDEPTESQKKAAADFVEKFMADYPACEPVTTETVDTMEWIRENRPDWLEE